MAKVEVSVTSAPPVVVASVRTFEDPAILMLLGLEDAA
jgi:hypothetical protein